MTLSKVSRAQEGIYISLASRPQKRPELHTQKVSKFTQKTTSALAGILTAVVLIISTTQFSSKYPKQGFQGLREDLQITKWLPDLKNCLNLAKEHILGLERGFPDHKGPHLTTKAA